MLLIRITCRGQARRCMRWRRGRGKEMRSLVLVGGGVHGGGQGRGGLVRDYACRAAQA